MKTNIKSKKFYVEAEGMDKGWGKYLKSIDELKDRVEQQKDITLGDACWVLYGEGCCSSVWEDFADYCRSKRWGKKTMPWEAWQGLFQKWSQFPHPDSDRIPTDGEIWLVFDLDNGHAPHKNYVWWFTAKDLALKHIGWQKKQADSARLSEPMKFYGAQ